MRMLARSPGFTTVAVVSLALGIAPNAAIFSLVDGLWMRPLAVANPDRIVRLFSVVSQDRGFRWFRVLARLAPGVSIRVANAQSQIIAGRLAAEWPATNHGRTVRVFPISITG